jgi:hypothetical protein
MLGPPAGRPANGNDRRGGQDPGSGPALRSRAPSTRAARRPPAPRHARRRRGPGPPAARGLGPARGDRARPPALDDPARAARDGQDHARAPRGGERERDVRGGLGGGGRACGGACGDGARAPPAGRDGLLPRRDPPLQQGPAGCAAARRRGGARDADRRHDGEPELRGQRRAALAVRALRAARARAGRRARRARARAGGAPRRDCGPGRRERRRRARGWRRDCGRRRARLPQRTQRRGRARRAQRAGARSPLKAT